MPSPLRNGGAVVDLFAIGLAHMLDRDAGTPRGASASRDASTSWLPFSGIGVGVEGVEGAEGRVAPLPIAATMDLVIYLLPRHASSLRSSAR